MKSRSRTRNGKRTRRGNKPRRRSRTTAAPYLLLISVSVLAVYSNSFQAGWYFDDKQNILQNTQIHLEEFSRSGLWSALTSQVGGRRPVSYLTFALNYYFSGLDPKPYHAVNLVIHWLNALLVFWTVRLITSRFHVGLRPTTLNLFAALTALLWSLHPIQTQAVMLVVQRMALLATLFCLLSFVCYLQWRSGPDKPGRFYFLTGSVVFALMAFGSKENSAILPFLMILYEFLLGRERGGAGRKTLLACLLIVVLMGGLVAWELQIGDQILIDYNHRPFTMTERLLTQPRIIAFHLSQMLLPLPSRLALAHEIELSSSFFSPLTTLPSMLLLAGIIATAIYWRQRRPLYCFWTFWLFLTLLIESSFLPLEMIFEHRFYLPSIGFLGAVMSLALPLPGKVTANQASIPDPVRYGLVPVLILLAYWSYERNKAWRDEVSLWQDNALKYPASTRVLINLGTAYMKADQPGPAESVFLRAFRVDPDHPGTRTNLALFRMRQGKPDDAVALIEDFDPSDHKIIAPIIFYNHAVIYDNQGNLNKAIENYRMALRRDANFSKAWFNLALDYTRKDNRTEARRCFREFLTRWDGKPDHPYVQEARRKIIELGTE